MKDDNSLAKFFKFYNYMQSNEWQIIRHERLKIDGFKCVICKKPENILIVHHLTYNRLYNESINDLITLCKNCHGWVHRVCPPKNIPEYVTQKVLDRIHFGYMDKQELWKTIEKIWLFDEIPDVWSMDIKNK